MRILWKIARAPLAVLAVGLLVWLVAFAPFGTHIERHVSSVSLVDVQSDAADLRTNELTLAGPERLEVEAAPEDVATAEGQPGESDALTLGEQREALNDPVQIGESLLHLSIVRAGTREAVAAQVFLVRLDAPANKFWGRGDQVQRDAYIPTGGEWLRDLPEGEYRVGCYEQPEGVEDPASFRVGPGRTEFEVVLPVVGRRTVKLVLVDGEGSSVERVHLRSKRGHTKYPTGPQWMTSRPYLLGDDYFISHVGNPEFWGSGPGPLLTARDGVFEIGTVSPATRGAGDLVTYKLEMEGMSRVDLVGSWESGVDALDQMFAAVQVQISSLQDAIWLETGERPELKKLKVFATCDATQVQNGAVAEACELAFVEVSVSYPGHEWLRFQWAPAAGPLGDKFLQLAPD